VVELIEDGCSVPASWADAMSMGFESMHAENARVVVTKNFVGTVVDLTADVSYTVERGSGSVAAKTITKPDGSVVVMDYDELSSRAPADIQRLAAHEGGHVVIDARGGEETSGNRDPGDTDWQWLLKCLGAQAIVEFRIERRLAELGYEAAEWGSVTAVDQGLLTVNAEIVSAVCDPASADPVHLHDAVVTTLNHATKMLAYIAAPLAAGRPSFAPTQLSSVGQSNWADYIAPTWTQRVALWSAIPSAAEPIAVEAWRSTLRECVLLEQKFMLDFGFAFENAPSGGGYGFYRRSGDPVFTERLRRLRSQVGT
jgi:hypothetical protein